MALKYHPTGVEPAPWGVKPGNNPIGGKDTLDSYT